MGGIGSVDGKIIGIEIDKPTPETTILCLGFSIQPSDTSVVINGMPVPSTITKNDSIEVENPPSNISSISVGGVNLKIGNLNLSSYKCRQTIIILTKITYIYEKTA